MANVKKEDVQKEVQKELEKRNVYDEDAVIAPYKEYDIGEISDNLAANIYTAFNKDEPEEEKEDEETIKDNGWETIKEYVHELNDQSDIFAPYKELDIDDVSDNVVARIYTAMNKNKDKE